MAPSSKTELLARVNFPLYTVKCLSDRHILVAGGGGTAKTGIDNVFEIFELINDAGKCKAKPVTRHETGIGAIMNSCVFFDGKHHIVATGMEGFCELFRLKWKILSVEKEGDVLPSKAVETVAERRDSGSTTVRKRHRTNSSSHESDNSKVPETENENLQKVHSKKGKKADVKDANDNSTCTEIGFDVISISKTQTDFSKDDPYQKVVRVTPDGSVIITGGADGSIRTWKYPRLQLLYTIKAHDDEIDDIDVSPKGDKIVSTSRDGHAYTWNTNNGSKNVEIKFMPPNSETGKYRLKSCRYTVLEGKRDRLKLFTTAVPVVVKKNPPSQCYLTRWNTTDYTPEKSVSTGADILTALTISDNGRFVAVGTLSGSIQIFIGFSLQKFRVIDGVHNFFITGLEFLSSSDHTRLITPGKEASLVSISVDNCLTINHIDEPGTIPLFLFVCILIGCLLLTFTLCDMIGL